MRIEHPGDQASDISRRRRHEPSVLAWIVLFVLAIAGAAVLGNRMGLRTGQTVTVRHGLAYSSGAQAEVTSDGVAYNLPLGEDSLWYSGDMEYEGSTPVCVRPQSREEISFGTVSFVENGALNSLVVWVRCP